MRRRAPLGGEELRRQLLALVLAFVLVWYTFVVPAGAAGARRPIHEDDENDGEVRDLKPRAAKGNSQSVEDLDWPEYIYP